MVSRWWNQWIWSSERRRHGAVIREVLDGWRPGSGDYAEPGGRPPPWVGDEELVTGVLALLWQGASSRDLARWLEAPLNIRYESGAGSGELQDLASKLVKVYENEIFSED